MPATSAAYGVLGTLDLPLALGLLRLSTEGRPAEAEAIEVVRFALEQGVRVLDTADSYATDDRDLHYGERLVRKALAAWEGPRDQVRVITKAGLARPKGRWVPNGRRDHLRRMVEGSLTALGVERLFMLLLHANELNADYSGKLFERLRERNYEFVPLARALEDPAYASPDAYVGRWGISWLHHWEQAMGRPRTGAPDPPSWVSEAYEKGRK